MKINQDLVLKGKRATLVPYEASHVLKYHSWMASKELQELTGSEPLSLEEEYSMQKSWREDNDKCTFIILANDSNAKSEKEEELMAGDVNLFFNDIDNLHSAEVEIMIAEPKYRRSGIGRESVLLMLQYGIHDLNVTKYTVKIGLANTPSREMFKRLNFQTESISEVFQEETLFLNVEDSQAIDNLVKECLGQPSPERYSYMEYSARLLTK